jgi:hypothetical protein
MWGLLRVCAACPSPCLNWSSNSVPPGTTRYVPHQDHTGYDTCALCLLFANQQLKTWGGGGAVSWLKLSMVCLPRHMLRPRSVCVGFMMNRMTHWDWFFEQELWFVHCRILVLHLSTVDIASRDSSVGIATRYRLDAPGIEPHRGRDFLHLSIPSLGPTQPSILQ